MKNEEVERLFRENYRRMFLVAVFLLHDEAEGKDVVHDVFETVMRNGIELRGETASGYLRSSTRNRCLNRLRSMRIKEKVANEYVIFSNLESVTDEDASEEKIATLNAGISHLQPPVRKKIIEMHFKHVCSSMIVMPKRPLQERIHWIRILFGWMICIRFKFPKR